MGLTGTVGVVADIAVASLDNVHYMKPVQVIADHGAVLDRVVAETGVRGADILVQHGLIMTGKTELKNVLVSVGAGFIVVFLWKGGSEQFFVLAAMGRMAGQAAVILRGGLVHVRHIQFLLDILDTLYFIAFLGGDLSVMAAQTKGLGARGEQRGLVA